MQVILHKYIHKCTYFLNTYIIFITSIFSHIIILNSLKNILTATVLGDKNFGRRGIRPVKTETSHAELVHHEATFTMTNKSLYE